MSIDRKALLVSRKQAQAILADPEYPPEIKSLAQQSLDKATAALELDPNKPTPTQIACPSNLTYSKEIGDRICHAIATGQSLRTVCRELHIDKSTVIEWIENPALEAFASQYAHARRVAESVPKKKKRTQATLGSPAAAVKDSTTHQELSIPSGRGGMFFIQAYLFLSIAVAITGGLKAGWVTAFYAVSSGFLSLIAGGGLKYCLWWGDKTQKIGMPVIAILLLGFAQWLSDGFSVHLFGYFLSGAMWSWIGFVICFLCTDKKLAGITHMAKVAQEPAPRRTQEELAQQYFKKGEDYYYGADEDGVEVQQDFEEAIKWFRKAAELGNGEARYQLGVAYCSGEGVPKDYVQAYMWFSLSENSSWTVFISPSVNEQKEELENYLTPAQITEAQKLAQEWKEIMLKN